MKKLLALVVALLLVVPMLSLAEMDQTASDQLHAMQKLVRETDNITITGSHVLTYTLNGTETTTTYADLTITFHDPLIIHNIIYPVTEDAAQVDMFMVQQGDEMVVYASNGKEEYESYAKEIEKDELVADTMGELDSVTHAIDSMIAAEVVGEETVTVNGAEHSCIRIDMTADVLEMVDELVHNTLISNWAFDAKWTNDIEVSLANVTVPFSYWYDKDTGMLVQFTSDLTEVMAGIYAYIPDEIDGGFVFTEYISTYQVTGVNDAEEIVIPAAYIAYNEH